MAELLKFKESEAFTIGVELELQLVDLNTFNLTLEAEDLLRRIQGTEHEKNIKPEITQSMIEVNSSIHTNYHDLLNELNAINTTLLEAAKKVNIGISGGGTHPFQKWREQKIFQTERFRFVSEQYGFLAKQFTVFGQHVHIGCENPDDALYLCHAFAYYIPHFIALSAASPFNQSIDTSFDCSRLSVISAFPLSGTPPWVFKWKDFMKFFKRLYDLQVVASMKDFYWDIRPKPEFGTIEIRIFDTPLTVQQACDMAFYANCLARYLLKNRPEISRDVYITYLINRFRATRFGLDAQIIDITYPAQKSLKEDILHTCYQIEEFAAITGSMECLERIKKVAYNNCNDARLLRDKFTEKGTLEDVVRFQLESWAL